MFHVHVYGALQGMDRCSLVLCILAPPTHLYGITIEHGKPVIEGESLGFTPNEHPLPLTW